MSPPRDADMIGRTCLPVGWTNRTDLRDEEDTDMSGGSSPAPADRRTSANIFSAYIEFMKIMLSNLFIINAGSAVALIAFFGNYSVNSSAKDVTLLSFDNVRDAVITFGLGAFLAIMATGSAAITEQINSSIRESGKDKLNIVFGVITAAFIFMSAVSFFHACSSAVRKPPVKDPPKSTENFLTHRLRA